MLTHTCTSILNLLAPCSVASSSHSRPPVHTHLILFCSPAPDRFGYAFGFSSCDCLGYTPHNAADVIDPHALVSSRLVIASDMPLIMQRM